MTESIIHVLDDSTINKIAAGEVVERPASVVKELVENAMDAGARRIEVEIMAGGTSLIRVTDDGRGMSAADTRMALKRHATSKIHEVSDLNTISTLGFRGEALPTIASVSRFSLKTRREGADLGTSAEVVGGKPPELMECGTALGTTIRVEDLFFNTPARKKFLKTNSTEAAHINDYIVKLALSRPDIELRFIRDNKLTVTTPGSGDLKETLVAIYGFRLEESLLPVAFEDAEVKITGFITKPSFLKSSRSYQTYIVNGRVIQNRAIAKAVDNAYKSLIPKSGFPLAALNIEVPQRSIDVNVHPQKTELKFEDEGRIFKAVYKAVLDSIRPAGAALSSMAAPVERPKLDAGEGLSLFAGERKGFNNGANSTAYVATSQAPIKMPQPSPILSGEGSVSFSEAQALLKRERDAASFGQAEDGASIVAEEPPAYEGRMEQGVSGERVFAFSGRLTPIGQVALTYIVAQDEDALYIIDQHAAHERILFDHLSSMADKIPSQQLLMHKILTLDPKEYALLEKNLETFSRLGFTLESAGGHDMRLMEVPVDVRVEEAEDLLREILSGLFELRAPSAAEIREHVLATTACRAAIKAGEVLNLKQMELLLEELGETAFPYTCPHGRPTIIKFSSLDLAKMFKRTGFNLSTKEY